MESIAAPNGNRFQWWLERFMVAALLIVVTTGAFFYMVASMEGSHLRYRDASLKKTAAMSVENKLVVDEYIRCWQDLRHNPSPKCALESAAMGRSQGRTEAQVSVLLGNMGIFEQGCIRTDTMDLIAVLANDELKGLMGKWCSGKTR